MYMCLRITSGIYIYTYKYIYTHQVCKASAETRPVRSLDEMGPKEKVCTVCHTMTDGTMHCIASSQPSLHSEID